MSTKGQNLTFVNAVLAGEAVTEDIDAYIDAWHENPGEKSLAEFLGFSEHEYALWVEQPNVIDFLISAKRSHTPVEDLCDMSEAHRLAARSTSQGNAEVLIEWLNRASRLSQSPTSQVVQQRNRRDRRSR